MSLSSAPDAALIPPAPVAVRLMIAALAPPESGTPETVQSVPPVSPFTMTTASLVGGAWIAATVLICLLLRARSLKRP